MPSPPSSPPAPDEAPRTIRIEPTRGWTALRLGQLWEYRELLGFLAQRDIKVRYKQTVLGATWAVLQPVATAVVFTLVFGRLVKVPSDGVPYAVFALAGLVVWNFFSTSVSTASASLVSNTDLVSKVYFPRLSVPIASMIASFVDFLIATGVLLVAMAFFGVGGGWRMFLAIPVALLAFTVALGASLWLSAAMALYRDVRHLVPFLVQFGLFATPVAYPATLLSGSWQWLYSLNPMVGVVEGFRWAMLGTATDPWAALLISVGVAAALLASGTIFFRRVERTLADVI
ncbi:ABC transporter permease [Nocardioides aurantiacus]|uniref:Transport permease protein n=1 Tax=Nocardioides aurantiacus TaxID=86796 RepID=A0A3N2CRE8_9ACTN|nr:ABC transporter permease [Nocardioides aurantiacus]ROR90127.1 lipopolysaccharide transport system permease protein [Nocardioides aurantiacus]